MEIQVATLCDAATDYNAKLCILGAFDTIGVAKLPIEHPQCSVALRIIFTDEDNGKHKLTIRMIDEDGRVVKPVEIESTFEVRMPDSLATMQAFLMEFVPGKPLSRDNLRSMEINSICDKNGYEKLGIQPRSAATWIPRIARDKGRTDKLDTFRRSAGR